MTVRGVARQFNIPPQTFRDNLNKVPDPDTGMVEVGHTNLHKMLFTVAEEKVGVLILPSLDIYLSNTISYST